MRLRGNATLGLWHRLSAFRSAGALSLQERRLERTQLAAVDLLEGGGAGHVAMRCVRLNELTKGRVLCLRERSDHLGGKGGCGKGGG